MNTNSVKKIKQKKREIFEKIDFEYKYETLSLHFFWTLKPTKYTKNIQIFRETASVLFISICSQFSSVF